MNGSARLPWPRMVLFDWDNTLVDTWPVITDCYNAVFDAFGQAHWSIEEVKARAHGSLRDYFPMLFGERWREAADIFFATFHRIHLERLTPCPGAVDLIGFLRERQVPLGVVSNKVGANLRVEAAHLGWSGHFHRIVGATDAVRDKPAPDPVYMALEGAGVATGAAVWLVGDTRVDLVCAHAAGCIPVLLRDLKPCDGEFDDCLPALHSRNCHALRALLTDESILYRS